MVALAAICNAKMDKYMIDYMNLTDNQKTLEYYLKNKPSWYSFDPRAKYQNFESGKRSYNKLLLKIGIKTTWLSDNFNDAWHFLKSNMIVLLCLAIAINALTVIDNWLDINNTLNAILIIFAQLITLGIFWNITFNYSLKKFRNPTTNN